MKKTENKQNNPRWLKDKDQKTKRAFKNLISIEIHNSKSLLKIVNGNTNNFRQFTVKEKVD